MNNLFIVGAQRSGSTYLYQLLDAHPQIEMIKPLRPEPKFFSNDDLFSHGRDYYKKLYHNNLDNISYVGEKSTSYLEIPLVAERIQSYFPNSKILIILRNPVIRAFSNYRFSVEHGLETETFSHAIKLESQRLNESYNTSVNPYAYKMRGFYLNYLENFCKYFSNEQIKIVILEDLIGNLSEVRDLYKWLAIHEEYIPTPINYIFNETKSVEFTHNDIFCFRDLAISYLSQLDKLEKFLNRKLEKWRVHWESL